MTIVEQMKAAIIATGGTPEGNTIAELMPQYASSFGAGGPRIKVEYTQDPETDEWTCSETLDDLLELAAGDANVFAVANISTGYVNVFYLMNYSIGEEDKEVLWVSVSGQVTTIDHNTDGITVTDQQ